MFNGMRALRRTWHQTQNAVFRCRCSATTPALLAATGAAHEGCDPPALEPKPATVSAYGRSWHDEYSWITDQPAHAAAALQSEARYFHLWAKSKGMYALANRLEAEIKASLHSSTCTVPERVGQHWYYVRQTQDRPRECYVRRPAVDARPMAPQEEIVLDVNDVAQRYGDDIEVGQIKLSRCGALLAFTVAFGGQDDVHECFVRDIANDATWQQPGLRGVVSVEWADDARYEDENGSQGANLVLPPTLLATVPDELGRPWRVIAQRAVAHAHDSRARSVVGGWFRAFTNKDTPRNRPKAHVLLEEKDPRHFLELQRSKDWALLLINSHSKSCSEVHVLPASDPRKAALRCIQPRRPGLEYFAEHHSGVLLLVGNAASTCEYGLFAARLEDRSLECKHWQVIVPPRQDVALEDVDVYRSGIVLHERVCGVPRLTVIPMHNPAVGFESTSPFRPPLTQRDYQQNKLSNRASKQACFFKLESSYNLPLPSWALSVTSGANADFESNTVRLELSSPVHPDQTYEWDLSTRCWAELPTLAKDRNDVSASSTSTSNGVHGFQPSEFECLRSLASSEDGTPIPLTISYAKQHMQRNGNAPCLMVVYAAYGHAVPTDFLAERVPLLRRGWIVCIVHARGGGELGRSWHAAGRGAQKARSAEDVIAAAEFMITNGYTHHGRIALEATSAGAVAAGGALKRRSGAFGAAVLESPFVEMLGTLCDPLLPLSQHEYDEWGDPTTDEGFNSIQSNCPYYNVRHGQHFPPLLITCTSDDARVPFQGPLKYANRVRAACPKQNQVFVLPDAHAGHLPGERERYSVKSLQYAWVMNAWNEL